MRDDPVGRRRSRGLAAPERPTTKELDAGRADHRISQRRQYPGAKKGARSILKIPRRVANWELPKLSMLEGSTLEFRTRLDEREIKGKARSVDRKVVAILGARRSGGHQARSRGDHVRIQTRGRRQDQQDHRFGRRLVAGAQQRIGAHHRAHPGTRRGRDRNFQLAARIGLREGHHLAGEVSGTPRSSCRWRWDARPTANRGSRTCARCRTCSSPAPPVRENRCSSCR